MKIVLYNCKNADFIMDDLRDSHDCLSEYINRCLDGFTRFVPDLLTFTYDGILKYIIRDGVGSVDSDRISDYFASQNFLDIANKDDCVTLRYAGNSPAIDILVSPPPGVTRTRLPDMVHNVVTSTGMSNVSFVDFSYFVDTKVFCYKNRFGESFPMKYAVQDADDFVERLNICLYNGEKADLLAKRYNWS